MKSLKNKTSFIKFLILPLVLGLLLEVSSVNAIVSGPHIQPFFHVDIPSDNYISTSNKQELPFVSNLIYSASLANITRNTLSNSPGTYFPFFTYPVREWIPPVPEIYKSFTVHEMPLSLSYIDKSSLILSSSIGYNNTLHNNIVFYNANPGMFIPSQIFNLFGSNTDGAHPFPGYESLMVSGMPFSPEFYPWNPSFEKFFMDFLFPKESIDDNETNYTNGGEPNPEFFIVYVIGYVYDSSISYLPLEGVKVSIKNSTGGYLVKTHLTGRFLIELFPDVYTLVFSKEGYQDKELDVRVIGGMETLIIYMEKEIHNRTPVLDIPTIEVIAGEIIMFDPLSIAYDPDGDPLSFAFSGWRVDYLSSGFEYTTTEFDIGVHEIRITVSDSKSLISDVLEIIVWPGYDIFLCEGLNLISYPFEYGDPNFTAFDLLEELGGFPRIYSIAYYDNYADKYVNAYYDFNGIPLGEDFPIKMGDGYVVYANKDIQRRVINRYDRYAGEEDCLELHEGLNLIGIPSCPAEYTSYDLLMELKKNYAYSISYYDSFLGDWKFTYWAHGNPAGDIFPILMDEGYYINIQLGP
ncbi:MAG: hypothetical protein ACMUIU_13650 [bacterium]